MKKNTDVKRFELKDSASSYNRNLLDRIRTVAYQLRFRKQLMVGQNSIIKAGNEFKLTEGAFIAIGDHCTIKENSYFVLTKPKPCVEIGNYSGVGRNCYFSIKGHLKIGMYVRIGPDVSFIDQNHRFDPSDLIMNQHAVIENITINNDVWIGRGVTLLPGVTVGEGSVIGANSLVNKSIPENEIWGGVPARFLKIRS